MKLEQRQPEPAMNISIAELGQIAFRKRKAREITDVVLSILGLAKYKIKKYEESIEILENIQHKSAEIFLYIGNSYMLLPKPDLLRGVALGDSKQYEKAEKAYKEALRINPNDAFAHNNLGGLLKELKRYKEAEKEYKEVLRINSDDAWAHNNLGLLLYELKRYEEAEKEYKKALQTNPDYAKAHYNLGNLLYDLKRYPGAEKEYKEALQINPDYAEVHYSLGILLSDLENLLMDLNRKDEAKKEFEIARDLFRKQGREEDAKSAEGFLKEL
jgi:tetratricopeptide (TPR) repeat protein